MLLLTNGNIEKAIDKIKPPRGAVDEVILLAIFSRNVYFENVELPGNACMVKKRLLVPFATLTLFLTSCQNPTLPVQEQPSYLHILPSWSKDGKTIAFIGTYNGVAGIYLVDSSGGAIHLLHAGNPTGCAWSPDSKQVVYSENYNLYTVDVSNDTVHTLTSLGEDMYPAWSPDGNSIAFSRQSLGIYQYNLATDTAVSVFQLGDFPSWHPNGELVALAALGGGDAGIVYAFYARDVDSLHWRTLLTFLSPDYCTYPSVSPAGTTEKEIVFSLVPYAGYTELWKIDIASGNVTQMTDDGGDYPSWSPDGSKMVYTRTQAGDGGLWIMNADGSGKHRLTSPS